MHFERQNAFQNEFDNVFSRKINKFKKMCVSTETHFLFGLYTGDLLFGQKKDAM